MAFLAYLLPPASGLLVYLRTSSRRARFHGLQAVVFGVVWPAALYLGSWVTPGATQVVFALGAALWIVLLVSTALGFDPSAPGARRLLERAAASSPRG